MERQSTTLADSHKVPYSSSARNLGRFFERLGKVADISVSIVTFKVKRYYGPSYPMLGVRARFMVENQSEITALRQYLSDLHCLYTFLQWSSSCPGQLIAEYKILI